MFAPDQAPGPSTAIYSGTHDRSYSSTTYAISVALLCLGIVGLFTDPLVIFIAGAFACGWSEVDGFCGSSHICSFEAVRALEGKRRWLIAVSAYTLAGCLTAAVVGAAFGAFSFMVAPIAIHVVYVTLALATVLIARELRMLRFELPQIHLQTQKMWAKEFGFTTAAGMWGAHIGLGFATVIRHGGIFIVLIAIALHGWLFGLVLMTAFWIGRTLPMWFGRLMTNGRSSAEIAVELHSGQVAYRYIAVLGMLLLAVALTRAVLQD